ncbi:MAG: L,D-transpeptidase [Bacillota bacterium]|nr:L,D-transpeptidase [Bacillota bacterium]
MLKKRNILTVIIITAILVTSAALTAFTNQKGALSVYVDKLFTRQQKNQIKTSAAPAKKTLASVQGTAVTQEQNKPLSQVLNDKGITSLNTGLKIVVTKSQHTLALVYNGTTLKTYHVELGSGGSGDKQVEGDKKTPEGTFFIGDKKILDPPDYYLGTRWMGISYPSPLDARRGLQEGFIDRQTYNEIVNDFDSGKLPPQETALGGEVGIHGGSVPGFGPDWTWGCVGLANSDIEDFFNYIAVGTPVIIQK